MTDDASRGMGRSEASWWPWRPRRHAALWCFIELRVAGRCLSRASNRGGSESWMQCAEKDIPARSSKRGATCGTHERWAARN
jgi:hypothetical protein